MPRITVTLFQYLAKKIPLYPICWFVGFPPNVITEALVGENGGVRRLTASTDGETLT